MDLSGLSIDETQLKELMVSAFFSKPVIQEFTIDGEHINTSCVTPAGKKRFDGNLHRCHLASCNFVTSLNIPFF